MRLRLSLSEPQHRTCVANASIVDLNPDLMRLRRSNFNIFDGKVLAGFPGNGSLARNGLVMAMQVSRRCCASLGEVG